MTASNIQKYKKENIVVLSNSIIDSSNLPIMEKTEIGEKFISSLDAQRIFYFAINKISQAKREDKESIFDKDIFISVDEIVKATNLTRDRLYTIMKKAAQALQSSFIESYHPGDILKKNFTFTALVTQCKYESEGNAGIYVSLNPKLKDFLIIDSNFTQLSLQSLVRLNTKYSLKLYSYLKSQRDKYSHKNEIEVTLEKLRFLLFTNKIKEYNNYPSLRTLRFSDG